MFKWQQLICCPKVLLMLVKFDGHFLTRFILVARLRLVLWLKSPGLFLVGRHSCVYVCCFAAVENLRMRNTFHWNVWTNTFDLRPISWERGNKSFQRMTDGFSFLHFSPQSNFNNVTSGLFFFCFVANKTSGQWCSGWNCCLSATRSWNQTQLCEWSLHVPHRLCVGFHWVLRFPPQLKIFHLQSVSLTTPLTPDLHVVSAQWVSPAPLATFHCPVVWQIKFYLAN